MIVDDTNVLADLLLPGPKTSLAEALLLDHPQWAAPPLWRSHWRNVLATFLRRDLLNLPAALALIQQAEAILSAHEEPVSSEQVLELVSRRSCSAYGCEFVVAARQMGVPLVTEDQMILAALPLEARHLHQPSS